MRTLKSKRTDLESFKPFKLVKYVSLSSLVVILVCTLLLSSFITARAKAILIQKSEQYAFLLAESINHQVFFEFTLPTLIVDGEIRLSRKNQYERLDKVVRNTIHGFSVERVNIYDPDQVLTYSTVPGRIGTKGDLGLPFQRALKEETVSYVLGGVGKTFLGFEYNGGIRQLKTYLPMWEELPMSLKKGKVLGVFEITQNMTRDYESIHRFQLIIFSGFLIFVGVLFTTIILIARRADTIIADRTTERNKLEERLHQAERLAALGEMVAGVSHEIRNPLGIIRSTAELLHSRAENERQKRFCSIIMEESTRLNDILTEFLDFARPKTLSPSQCKVENILDRNLSVVEPECQKLGVTVERHYEVGNYTMEADGDMLYRAFVNLFSNSLQAMPEGGVLRVNTGLINGKGGLPQIEIQISDTGHGIPADIQKKIFNPFFTTHETGTGLGLAIVQSIIDSHNGDIELQSQAGEGTTIILRLPLFQPHSAGVEELTV
jgi:two-component system, NtrC family, sensor histidine kinase HydH